MKSDRAIEARSIMPAQMGKDASEFPRPAENSIIILGIDPGLRRTGFAVAQVDPIKRCIRSVLDLGTIETERDTHRTLRKTSDDLRRAQIQAAALEQLIERFSVAIIAMEMCTTTPYILPTFSFGVMTGIVATLRRPICQVLPHELKSAATGDPRGTKRDVIEWAIRQPSDSINCWPTSSKPNALKIQFRGGYVTLAAEHPADALAAIEAALRTDQFHLASAMSV